MIIDSLQNAGLYESLHPHFKQAFDYLKNTDLSQLQPGKTALDGSNLTVAISDNHLKNPADAKLETHDEYIDIQIPLSAPETYGWKQRAECKIVAQPYNAEKDIAFFGDVPTTYVTLQPGEFVIFFPEDGHAPCIGTGDLRKMLFKVRVRK
jgi:YhcH/YjgK/YiaL family protein